VIGGAGGLGEAWSEYMIRTYKAQIIWIGRRQKDSAIQARLDRLAGLGPAPIYIAADATDRNSLQNAYEEIKGQYSRINGVIHSAIVLLDKSLANMEEEWFKASLAAKVNVSVRMAQVFQKESLDFVLFFSSMQSFVKAPGQSNYAAGCTFKDAFAHQLNQQWPCAVKVINWGYWGSVGVASSKDYRDRMARLGIGSIEPPEAMEALETLLAGPVDQISLMKTTEALEIGFKAKAIEKRDKAGASAVQSGISGDLLRDKSIDYMKKLVGETLKIPAQEIDSSKALVEYGLDSLFVVQLTNILRKELKNITNTVIFEHQTIDGLVDHFIKTQKEALIRLVNFKPDNNSFVAGYAADTDNVKNADHMKLSMADIQSVSEGGQGIQPQLAAKLLKHIDNMSDVEVNILLSKL
ncbi:MAG TPA: hypothetical protein DEF36_02135, partial [Desulfotomaculum sp.]|nr:hypothetical protein [Desulfotomaculum sp.]